MNKGLIAIVGVLLVGIVGIVVIRGSWGNTNQESMLDATPVGEDLPTKDSTEDEQIAKDEPVMEADSYIEHSEGILDSPTTNRRVLFFYASWCPTCRPADADFQNNSSKIPEDVTVIRVDYSDDQTSKEEETLADTYGVTYQHTFVQIDVDANEVAKWNGGQLDELLENII